MKFKLYGLPKKYPRRMPSVLTRSTQRCFAWSTVRDFRFFLMEPFGTTQPVRRPLYWGDPFAMRGHSLEDAR